MLKINLPGCKNALIINDTSVNSIIEEELSKNFFPYFSNEFIEFNAQSTDLLIDTDGYNIRIKKKSGEYITILCKSIFETYKKIISIFRDNIQLEASYSFLHGSAIEINDCCCLFLAQTGTGKSTFSVYCDFYNNTCITDDLIIIEKNSLQVFPISKNAHIRNNGLNLFPFGHSFFEYNSHIDRWEYNLSDERFKNKKHIAKYIFFLNRGNKGVKIVSTPNLQQKILDNMFLPYQVVNNITSSYNIGNKIKAFDIYYDDLDMLLKRITTFLKA